jgi:hypothetical protein
MYFARSSTVVALHVSNARHAALAALSTSSASLRDPAHDLFGGGVDHVDGPGPGGRRPRAVDVELVAVCMKAPRCDLTVWSIYRRRLTRATRTSRPDGGEAALYDQRAHAPVNAPPTNAPRRTRDSIVDAVGVAAATVGLLIVTLRLWQANFRVPFVYNATDRPPLAYALDAPYYLMLTKGLVEHGFYLRIPNLGWPFSLQLYDNPETGDNLQLALLRGLGFILRDAVLTVNVYYLLTFVAVYAIIMSDKVNRAIIALLGAGP